MTLRRSPKDSVEGGVEGGVEDGVKAFEETFGITGTTGTNETRPRIE